MVPAATKFNFFSLTSGLVIALNTFWGRGNGLFLCICNTNLLKEFSSTRKPDYFDMYNSISISTILRYYKQVLVEQNFILCATYFENKNIDHNRDKIYYIFKRFIVKIMLFNTISFYLKSPTNIID